MIWQLAREQLRSQKRFVVWTAVLLTLTVAVATFGALTIVTQKEADDRSIVAAGQDRPWHLGVDSWAITPGSDRTPTVETVDNAIDDARANGSDVVVSRSFPIGLDSPDNNGVYDVQALTGDVPWHQILVEGDVPSTGQIAVPAQYAKDHDLQIGDDAALSAMWVEDPVSLEISALTYSPVTTSNFTAWFARGYVAWEDSSELALALNPDPTEGAEPWSAPVYTQLSWTVGDPALNALTTVQSGAPTYNVRFWGPGYSSSSTAYTVVIGLALLLGLVAMAFAVGRSQAQVRLRWVATARTLGATRGTIAAATVLETVVVGAFASALGIAVGYLVTTVSLAAARATVIEPALPSTVSLTWFIVLGALALGLVIAIIIGAIPAFWASRVSPVAALKPVNDVTEAEVSRRVSSRVIYLTWGATVTALAALRWVNPQHALGQGALILLTITAVALGIAVLMDALRFTMAGLGRRLSASGTPWAIAAGDALAARPRQAAIPAFIMTALMAGVVAVVIYIYYSNSIADVYHELNASFGWFAYTPSDQSFAQILGVAGVGLVIVALTTFAIAGSAQRAVGADAATREALGLTPGATRLATGFQYAVPLAIGVAVGWAVGLFITMWLLPSATSDMFGEPLALVDVIQASLSTVLPVLVVIACGLVTAAIVGVTLALTTRTGAPVKQLQHSS